MRYRNLGGTGLLVSELCLGTMTFGSGGDALPKFGALGQQDANRLVAMAVDAGINFIDTADVYAAGQSEVITGQALRDLGLRREEIVVATKVFGPMGDGPNSRGNSRAHILDAAKASLKRLQLDHIDLYQLHGFDNETPIEESLRALDTLVQQGHVRYVGVSNWAAWQIARALGISERHGLARFASDQAYYTIAGRDLERELAPMMLSEGLGLMVWSPLAGGLLSGKYRGGSEGRLSEFPFPPVDMPRACSIISAMEPIAKARDVSLAQIAIAWLLHQPVVTSVLVGATRETQLADNIAATEVSLDAEELAALDEVSRLPREYPGWMLEFMGNVRAGATPRQATTLTGAPAPQN